MPLVAYGLGGLIDATRTDLDVGGSWESVYRLRPRVALSCPACGGSMHAKVSPRGLRFFAHDAARGECPLTGETPDHRLLKSAIAAAVRLAGWHATLEAEGPGRRWRADVLAVSSDGGRRVAWEAQLARQHDDDTCARTARYADDGVEVVWVFDCQVPREVPAVEVTVERDSIHVVGPVARLVVERCEPDACVRYSDLPSRPRCPGHARWEKVTFALEVFVALLCRSDMVQAVLTPLDPTDRAGRAGLDSGKLSGRWWTSPTFLRHGHAVRQAQQETDDAVADQRAQLRASLQAQEERERQRRRAALAWREQQRQRHADNLAALLARQRQLEPVVVQHVADQTGTKPWAMREGDPEHAMGISILYQGQVLAVLCPVAYRITPLVAERLAAVTVYVASEHERRALAWRCQAGQRFVVVSDPAS